MAGLTFSEIENYGGYTCSVVFFLQWMYQIIRSLTYYYRMKKNDEQELKSILSIHLIILVVNGLYLAYEL